MKKGLLFTLTALSVLLFCGCTDNSLKYVDAGAQYVIFGDTARLMKNKLWNRFRETKLYKETLRINWETLQLAPEDFAGNFAVWGMGNQLAGAVLVIDGDAEKLLDKLKNNPQLSRSGATVSKELWNGRPMLNVGNELFLVCSRPNTLQLFVGSPPAELLRPHYRSKLAKMIDPHAVFGMVITDAAVRQLMGPGKYQGDLPGTSMLILRGSDKKISIEASWDISNVEDPFALLELL